MKKTSVLFVDDETRILKTLKATFRHDYQVYTATSGAQALEILQQYTIDVIVSDQRMPNMCGDELLTEVNKRHPNTVRLLLTGFSDRDAIIKTINQAEIFRFISKPWDDGDIKKTIAEAAEAASTPFQLSKPLSQKKNKKPTNILNDKTTYLGSAVVVSKTQAIRNKVHKFCRSRSIKAFGTASIGQTVSVIKAKKDIGFIVYDLSVDEDAVAAIGLLKHTYPEIVTIALTDENDASIAIDLINGGQVYRYLSLPILDGWLFLALEEAINRHCFLKDNQASQQRYRVDEQRNNLSKSFQRVLTYFKRSIESK